MSKQKQEPLVREVRELKDQNEIWMNPLIPLPDRLDIARGAIRFRDDQIANLRRRLSAAQQQRGIGEDAEHF